jgi:hypothetical protein
MSRRVSLHFKDKITVGFDRKEKFYFVLNHNDNPVVWFRSFNSKAIRDIWAHLDLKKNKHKLPPISDGRDEYWKQHDAIAKETTDKIIDRMRTASKSLDRVPDWARAK